MFQSKAALFLYAVSPVHMGAGTAIGAIDNPIQRERHTGHPVIAGSGLKGAMRHDANALWAADPELVERIFGPDPEREAAHEHAGALSLGDAQIVLFPVRSLRRSYVYATCPTALGRLGRLLALACGKNPLPAPPAVANMQCVLVNDQLKTPGSGRLVLETFEFEPVAQHAAALKTIAEWLRDHALPADAANDYFRSKVATDTVLLSDDIFAYFVRNATVVEPHVRISDLTGTADDGGLFYTENLPPESLLVSLVMASRERREGSSATAAGAGNGDGRLAAGDVLARVRAGDAARDLPGFDGRLLQVGGDATVGRGHVLLRFVTEA